MNKHQIAFSTATACLTFFAIPLIAAPVSIFNSGFEDITGETPVNEFTFGPLNGWDLYDPGGITAGGAGGTFFIGTLTPDAPTNFTAGAAQGEYGMQQTLSETLQTNTNYSLQVEIGNIASGTAQSGTFFDLDGLPGYRVDLLAGGVLLSQDNSSLSGFIPEGEFATSTVSFNTGATHSQIGQALQIRLVNLNQIDPLFPTANLEVDFDNVRLNASAVPEPSGMIYFAVGTMITLRRRRSAKSSRHQEFLA